MLTKESILSYLKEIKPKLKENGIEKIGLFGSFAKDKNDLLSDIDIMIKTSQKFVKNFKGVSAFLYLEDLRDELQNRFQRDVDICDESGLKDAKIDEVIYA